MQQYTTEPMSRTEKMKTHFNNENKRCVLNWKHKEYILTVLTMENAKKSESYKKPIFYIPLNVFMRCGAFWSALNLSTIFWEQRPYHMERTFQETEKIKGAYLIAFVDDSASICKEWAEKCINKLHDYPRDPKEDKVFIEIIVFQDSLKDELVNTIKMYMLQVSETDKKDIFNVFET
jgi:hypothetical protein